MIKEKIELDSFFLNCKDKSVFPEKAIQVYRNKDNGFSEGFKDINRYFKEIGSGGYEWFDKLSHYLIRNLELTADCGDQIIKDNLYEDAMEIAIDFINKIDYKGEIVGLMKNKKIVPVPVVRYKNSYLYLSDYIELAIDNVLYDFEVRKWLYSNKNIETGDYTRKELCKAEFSPKIENLSSAIKDFWDDIWNDITSKYKTERLEYIRKNKEFEMAQ